MTTTPTRLRPPVSSLALWTAIAGARDLDRLETEIERLNQCIDRVPGMPTRLPAHVRKAKPAVDHGADTTALPAQARHRRDPAPIPAPRRPRRLSPGGGRG